MDLSLVSIQLNLYDGIALGFFTTVILATLLDKFGDAMFRWGVAKPFYIRGRRLHHRDFLLIGLPVAYASLALLILAGLVRIVWSDLWTGLGTTLVLGAGCMVVDLALDYASSGAVRWRVFHHELIYLVVPAFAFSNFLRLAV